MIYQVEQTPTFERWIGKLRNSEAKGQIDDRVKRLRFGNFGDARSVGGGILELRIHAGPGYRIYFTRRSATVILLLCGGDKGSQRRDIEHAKRIAADQ